MNEYMDKVLTGKSGPKFVINVKTRQQALYLYKFIEKTFPQLSERERDIVKWFEKHGDKTVVLIRGIGCQHASIKELSQDFKIIGFHQFFDDATVFLDNEAAKPTADIIRDEIYKICSENVNPYTTEEEIAWLIKDKYFWLITDYNIETVQEENDYIIKLFFLMDGTEYGVSFIYKIKEVS